MSTDPDQIREEIRLTRGELSSDVNALAEGVKPGNVARRQVAEQTEHQAGPPFPFRESAFERFTLRVNLCKNPRIKIPSTTWRRRARGRPPAAHARPSRL